MKNFRNPCWVEALPAAKGSPYRMRDHTFDLTKFEDDRLSPVRGNAMQPFIRRTCRLHEEHNKLTMDSLYWRTILCTCYVSQVENKFTHRRNIGKPYRVRCLPYFYLIGPQKTGTTDLYNCLSFHPDVVPGMAKEPHWWTRSRLSGTTMEEYVDLFDQAADTIATNDVTVNGTDRPFHRQITGDASAELIWDNWDWRRQPENMDGDVMCDYVTYEINHLVIDHIRHVTPQARFVAMLRDPIKR